MLQLEKTIENLQSQYQLTLLPNAVSEVELLLKEHEASRQAILELFRFTQNESEQIITRIQQQVMFLDMISSIRCHLLSVLLLPLFQLNHVDMRDCLKVLQSKASVYRNQ
jgi:hypothetical protein